MKLNFVLLTTLSILTSIAFGQTKYIKTTDGEIVDTVTYSKLKGIQVEKMKSIFPTKGIKIVIKDNFKEIKRTKDSLIYTYVWDIKIGDPKAKESKSFEPDDYIDKEFPLPNLRTLDNKKISINDLKGKPTLINFWFTTCKPCIEEMPVLSGIKTQLKDSVNFIAITFEPNEKVKAFYKKHKFSFTQIANAEKFTDSMNMEAFPVNIFLDKNGVVKKIESGIPYLLDDKKKMKMGDGKEFLIALRELL
jgi:cytochrome c biogenesis protein CcmG/thiol:disulfide interchange protein DsbE